MNRFIIEDQIIELFPQLEIAVVVARGIKRSGEVGADSLEAIAALLSEANASAPARYLTEPELIKNRVIGVWREAFYKFRTRRGAHASIENLLKRASRGNGVGSISPLVDIYNSVSLDFALPIGGEDIAKFEGPLRLAITQGGDDFIGFGDEEPLATLPGEVAYLDDAGAVCRCFNWRDGARTMLTDETTDAFLIIESVDASRSADLRDAAAALAERVSKHLGGAVSIHMLDASARELEF